MHGPTASDLVGIKQGSVSARGHWFLLKQMWLLIGELVHGLQ